MNENRKSNSPNDAVEIDLKKVWAAFVTKWQLILIIGIICGIGGFVISNFVITPKYTAETIIMILNKQNESQTITTTDLSVSTTISNDFVNIATSRTAYEEVDARVGRDNAEINASIISNTRQISIKVTHTNPSKAKDVANCLAEVAAERICLIMDIPDMVRTVDEASTPTSKSYPSIHTFTVIGFLLGFLFTWALVAVKFLFNDKINVPEDVEKYLDASLLAVIPVYSTRDVEQTKRGKTHTRKKR